MSRSVSRVSPIAVAALALPLILAACGGSSSTSSSSTTASRSSSSSAPGASSGGATAPGVTSNSITVGGLAAVTGPLGDEYAPIWDGVQAYFNQINARGGVDGRKLILGPKLDDQTNPSRDVSQARVLVQSNIFAIVGVAVPIFPAGQYLATTGVPIFGWNVNTEWSDGPNLFGEKGSYVRFSQLSPAVAYLPMKVGATKAAGFCYTVTQSSDACRGQVNTWKQFGIDPVLVDASLPFGATDVTADINRLKSSGATFMATGLDINGNVLLSKTIKASGIYNKVAQFWPNGYDAKALAQFGRYMDRVYFFTPFVPYEYGFTQGMDRYLDAMHAGHIRISDVTLAGWINADLFVTALRQIGPNVTRQGVITAINKMTQYTAGGISPGIDWTVQHTSVGPFDCPAFLQVQNGQFANVYQYYGGHNPFVCFQSPNPTTTTPVKFPDPPSFFNSTHPAPKFASHITPPPGG